MPLESPSDPEFPWYEQNKNNEIPPQNLQLAQRDENVCACGAAGGCSIGIELGVGRGEEVWSWMEGLGAPA